VAALLVRIVCVIDIDFNRSGGGKPLAEDPELREWVFEAKIFTAG
jgi:hypothetical protein